MNPHLARSIRKNLQNVKKIEMEPVYFLITVNRLVFLTMFYSVVMLFLVKKILFGKGSISILGSYFLKYMRGFL